MNTSDGYRFNQFCSTYLRHTKGKWANQPFVLEDWQNDWVTELLRREDGKRVYREALLGLARKNGKSALCSALAIYFLIVEGLIEHGSEVYACAASKEQARVVFGEAKKMLETSHLLDYCKVYRDAIEVPDSGAIFKVLAADALKVHGLNPSVFIADEVHAWNDPELWHALATAGLARENPLGIAISTAGFNQNSILGDLYTRGKKGEPGFYFKWFEASDVNDPDTWKEGNPSSWITKEDLIRESKRHPRPVFNRLHLNRWTKQEEAWLPVGVWDACEDTSLSIEPGDEVWVGVDLGLKDDPTAIVEICPKEDKFVVRAHIFGKKDAHYLDEDGITSMAQVLAKLHEIAHEQAVQEFIFDPSGAYLMMEQLLSEGHNVIEYPQTNKRMAKASEVLYEMILKKQIAHNGDPYLSNHIEAAYVKWVGEGLRLWKDKKRSPMDASIALALASLRAQEQHATTGFDLVFF
jgi:phage terminase large subunit-like protein